MIHDLLISMAIGAVLGLIFAIWLSTTAWAKRPAKPSRPHPELRYAARTAERAGIWWAVFRLLNGLFGGQR